MLRKIRSCLHFAKHTKENLSDLNNNQDGNIFFMLFGAVAIVGLLGTAVMSTMRGPLSTMVEIQSRTKAESEMGVASHLALLEATELANAGDCDSDGFVEPLEFADASGLGPVGGGFLPNAVASSRIDPWGTEYGYCAWDAGAATDTIGCDIDASGINNRLDGNGDPTDETYTVIAIVSAGPDQVFSTTCIGGANPSISKTGDDMVVEFTYASANAASNGLWNLKSGDPTTAQIDKNLEITGAASFSAGIDLTSSSAALSLGAASMLFPNESTLATCNGANDGLIRINTAANPDFLELCDDPTGWVAIGGNLWSTGAGDDIYYDSGTTPQIGIGKTDPSEALDVVGNIDVSGNLDAGGDLIAGGNADITGTLDVTGTTTLGVLNASGAVDFDSTFNADGAATLGSTLSVSGSTTLSSTLDAQGTISNSTGDLTIGDNLVVTGTSDLQGSVSDSTGDLTLDDNIVITGTLDAQGTISNSTGNVSVSDNLDISNDLDVTGDVVGENITVNDNLYVGTAIRVDGDQLGPALNCSSSQKLEWNDGSGWSCVTDLQGGGGGGIPALDDLTDVAVTTPANGECLIYDNVSGDWENAPCIGTGAGIFEIVSNVIRVKSGAGNYTNDDFIIGSPQLDDDSDANHDSRMFFDKSKAAFRAGIVTGSEWDDGNVGDYSVAFGQNTTASGNNSFAAGVGVDASGNETFSFGNSTYVSGFAGIALGRHLSISGGRSTAFGESVTISSNESMGFGLGVPAGTYPIISANNSFGIFMGDQSGVDLSVSNRMGLYGGDLLIDDDGTSGSQGCIQYNGTTSELEFSDDCTTFTAFGNGSLGLWRDLTGGRIHYGTTSANQVGVGTSNPQTTLDVNGGVRVGSVSGGAAPTFMAFDDLSDVAVAAPADGDCVVYNNASGDWESGSCSGGITQIFEVTGGAGSEVVSSIDANVPYTTADFVFGSPQLDDDGNTNHDARMFFDKSKFAFRSGLVTGAQWDDANIGDYSIAMGGNTTASGLASTAMGTGTTASGLVSTAMGNATTASGDYSTTMGSNTTASALLSTAMGYDTTASGQSSTAIGHDNTASGVASTAMGEEVNANGPRSFAIGLQSATQATDPIITGDRSMVLFMDGGVSGANSTYDFTANDKFAVIGGEFQIDDVSASANKGCIRYNSAATELQYSDDCTTYASFASLSNAGAINDLSDAYTDYVTDHNMFFGNTAGNSILAGGNNNVFIGEIAGEDTTSGSYNVFIGKEAGRNNITGEWNTFVGDDSGRANTGGNYNTAFGGYSLRANIGGSQNTAIGDGTLEVNTSGGSNTALGRQALFTSGTGNNNVALGLNALHISNGASNNTAIGTNAGDNITTGDNNIIIGYSVDAASATGDSQINIGNVITGNMSTGDIAIIGTAALAHPSGTTAQRPSTGVNGMIRYNSTTNQLEGYENGAWVSMGSGAGSSSLWIDNTTHISRENFHILNAGQTSDSTSLSINGGGAAGIRTLYDADSGALRGGQIETGNDAWDNSNIGDFSLAWGSSAQATGIDSIALGDGVSATGNGAFAQGSGTIASGEDSVALGWNSRASGQTSLSFGPRSEAQGRFSVALMNRVIASGEGSVAFGLTTYSNNPSSYPTVSANQSFGIFMGDQSGVDLAVTNRMGLYGGDFLIDDDGTAGSQGCIRYLEGTGLQYSDDCTTFSSFASLGGAIAINDLSDAATDYTTDHNMLIGEDVANGLLAGNTYNLGIGEHALNGATTSQRNVAVGYAALYSNTAGYNSALGVATMYNATGSNNSAFGYRIMFDGGPGDDNTIMGYQAAYTLDGSDNVIMGSGAGQAATTADTNVMIGYQAGNLTTTGDSNIFIGNAVQASTITASNELNIGNVITGDMSTGDIAIIGTAALAHPSGTTAQRPSTGVNGMIRYNSTTNELEGYENGSWVSMGSGSAALTFPIDVEGETVIMEIGTGNVPVLVNAVANDNLFLGEGAGASVTPDTPSSTDGEHNTFIGISAGTATTSGQRNTYIGLAAGDTNTTGDGNTAVGRDAGGANITGDNNVYVGSAAGLLGTSASNQTMIGAGAGVFNNGSDSTFYGNFSGYNNAGSNSILVGSLAGRDSATASDAIMIGYAAGRYATANNNTLIGYQSGQAATGVGVMTGTNNTFLGYQTGLVTTSGADNTFIGDSVGTANTTGYQNTFVGVNAGNANIDGYYNAFFGAQTGAVNSSGFYNAFFGDYAGNDNTTGDSNTFIGSAAGFNNIGGLDNTFLGRSAGRISTAGGSNVFIGHETANNNTTGSRNIIIGANADNLTATTNDYLNIGDVIIGDLATGNIQIVGTAALTNPSGTTAQRPTTGVNGMIRYNSTLSKFEAYENSGWINMIGSAGGLWTDNTTHISRSNFHVLNTSLAAGSTTAGLDGNGTYSFYDPDKGAMRGGAISGGYSAWEDTNIGTNSFAWGLNAQASGLTSFAIGSGNVASGNVSFAVGDSSVASGNYSTAIGALATASGDFSTAIGIGASATGANSTALGAGASAIGANSTALGIKASASGDGAMAFGLTTAANNPATAPIVSGDESFGIFMGNQSGIDITDNNTMAVLGGDFIVGSYQLNDTTTGTEDSRMFFDRSNGAFRAGTTAGTQWNSANVGANSTAFGANTTASGDGSMAIGGNTTASGENSTAIGDSATASGDSSTAIGDTTTASGAVSIAMGEGTTASGEVSAAWGVDTIASGYTSVTWGQDTIASGENSIAIGRETSAGSGTAGDGDGDNSFAIGLQTAAQTTNPIITGDRSMVLYMDGGVANANSAYDFTASDKFAIIGGEFQIDDVSSSANKGCIRYNSATTEIQFSHDCSTYTAMGGGGSGAINDLSDAAKNLTTNNLFLAHNGGSVGATDNFNTVIGIEALDALNNSGADNNIAIGYQTLTANTNGDDNIAIGYQALSITTNGSDNIAIGSETLLVNSTGDRNIAIGNSALIANTLGDDNIVLGDGAMEENTSGNDNIAIGNTALGDNINGDDNIAIGTQTLAKNTDGHDNIAIGDGALTDAGSSEYSIAIGIDALGNFDGAANTYNTAIGYRSLRGTNGAAIGIENTALGANTGLIFTTGENNVLIGYNAGNSITTGSDNIIIGHDVDTPAATTSNYLNIGNTITGNISTKTVTIDAQSNAAGGLILTTDEGGQVDDLLILNNTNGGGNAAGITFKVTDTSRSRIYSYDSGMIIETLAATTPIVFQTNTTQRMVLSDSGIGIGNFNADTIESALHIQSGDIRLDGGAANEAGCIRFNDTTDQLQFSHDCSTYTAMGSASGLAINDLTDAYTDYTTDNNMFIGSSAGAAIASGGTQNIFIGESSGALITTSDGNTAVGFETLDVNTSGEYQAAFGSRTLTNNTTGTKNAAFGASAMHYNTDGSNNVALGHLAGRGNSGGASPENSAFIGYYSGLNITTGINNTLLGYNTGATLTTGGNNILIGASTNVPTSSTSNYLNIGNTIYGDLSNGLVGIGTASPTGKLDVITANNSSDTILRIGSGVDNSNTANSTLELRERNGGTYNRGVDLVYNGATGDHFAINVINSGGTTEALRILRSNGYVGINNAAPDAELDVTGDIEYSGTLTDVSDRRLKNNIKPLGQTLDRITQIDTYSFTMKDDKKGRTEFGVMAQELEEIFPTLVHTAKDEMGTKSVNYVGLIAPMIEATKELRAENAALKAELSGVKTAQAQTTQALKDLSQQVALLNKMAGNNVGKASMMPYFMLLFGLLGGMGFMLLIQRKQQK